mgnify:CR=1 FL=1
MRHDIFRHWTAEEDDLMIELVRLHGLKWQDIIVEFPGRTTASLRNRWSRLHTFGGGVGKKICRRCGAPRRGHICRGLTGSKGSSVFSSDDPPPHPPSEPPVTPYANSFLCTATPDDTERMMQNVEIDTTAREMFSTHVPQMWDEWW